VIKLFLAVWLSMDFSGITEDSFRLHPALGVVIVVDTVDSEGHTVSYEVAYPIKATNPVVRCHQIISVDLDVTLCYNFTEIVLGEPTMFKPHWCESCIWQSMDLFPSHSIEGETK